MTLVYLLSRFGIAMFQCRKLSEHSEMFNISQWLHNLLIFFIERVLQVVFKLMLWPVNKPHRVFYYFECHSVYYTLLKIGFLHIATELCGNFIVSFIVVSLF